MTEKPSTTNKLVYMLIGAALLLVIAAVIVISINANRAGGNDREDQTQESTLQSPDIQENQSDSNQGAQPEDPTLPTAPVIELPTQ